MSGREESQPVFPQALGIISQPPGRQADPGGVQSLLACRSAGESHTTVIAGEMKSAEADDNAASSSKVFRAHPSQPVSRYHVLTEGENDLT